MLFLNLIKYNYKFIIKNWISRLFLLMSVLVIAIGLILIHQRDDNNSNVREYKTFYSLEYPDLSDLNKLMTSSNTKLIPTSSDVSSDISIIMNGKENINIVVNNKNIDQKTVYYIVNSIDILVNSKNYSIQYEYKNNQSKENKEILSYVISFILYLSILVVGNLVVTTVSLEKTSKMLNLISYKVDATKIIYAKILAIILYLLTLLSIVLFEINIAITSKFIDVKLIKNYFKDIEISKESMILLLVAVIVGMIIYIQLYAITGLMLTDASQIQLSQLPLTMVTLICYTINIYIISITDLSDTLYYIGAMVPFTFPFGLIITIFFKSEIMINYFLIGIVSSLIFLVITFLLMRNKILPKRMY